MTDRFLIIPPNTRNVLMGIARFTEQAFTGEAAGGNTIRNGQVGDVYGVKVYVSTNADTAAGNSATDRICLLAHKDAFVFLLSKWAYVHKLSTSKSTSVRYSPQICFTV